MGYQTDFATGVALLLHDAGIGTYNPNGAYAAGQTGIVFRTLPQAPDRVIVLSTYGIDDDPSLSDSVTGLQIITRWEGLDPRPGDNLADSIFDQLHGLHGRTLATGVRLVQCRRQSIASLGSDKNDRWRTSQNFYIDAHRPSLNRT